MDLDVLLELSPSDRWTFVRGRIGTEAVHMDAALSGVHAALRDRHDREALLEAPESWGAKMRECNDRLAARSVPAPLRAAMEYALRDAALAWRERNRYMHDLLVDRLDVDDAPAELSETRADDARYRLRLSRKKDVPETVSVSFDEAVDLVCKLVSATWRLRATRHCLSNVSSVWRSMLLGAVEGDWDGTASWVTSSDSDEDQ